LKNARAAIRNRENQRLARTRAFAVVRRMFRSVGATWARRGFLGEERDVFYLTLDEIREAALDEAALGGLTSLVRERKETYERYRAMPPPPERFVTCGEIDDDTPLVGEEAVAGGDGALEGLGACPGVVEGEAVVLHEPDTTVKIDGEILVAPLTDPGWVLLFPSISGLVVERGSMLSHSAIVAREMGIPAVVGVKGATAAIATGDRLRIDGGRGTVELL
jgi:pyruvate,water dikinase